MQLIPEPKDPIQRKLDGQYVPATIPRRDRETRTFISELLKFFSSLARK